MTGLPDSAWAHPRPRYRPRRVGFESCVSPGLHKGVSLQRSQALRVFNGLGVAKRCYSADSIGDTFMQR